MKKCVNLIFCLALLSTETLGQFVSSQKTNKKPNIIYVMVDQLRYDALGYSGDQKAQTPNLDILASQSMNFDNTISVTPVCSAHRASLLTGKYTSSTGVVVNELRLNPNQRSIAHVLGENGYDTSYIGKWHLYSNCSRHNEVECAYIPPGEHRLGFDDEWKAFNFHHDNYKGYYFEDQPKKIKYEKPYEPEAQFDFALEYLSEASKKDNPFALWLSIGVPHDPWSEDNVPAENLKRFEKTEFKLPTNWSDVPDKYMDRNTDPEQWISHWKENIPEMMRVYYAMVSSIDDQMGRLMKRLDELGLADNTILVFSSDHGEMFGENGRVYKLTFYESAARVQFLIRWPGKIKRQLLTPS
jgi:arylsulfatase A-like enzyme